MDENIQPINRAQIPAMLAVLADQVEASPNNRDAIATGLRLVALALEPCEDCGADPLPEIDLADTATGEVA